ncbi:hypothetical protein PHYBOEH_007929 [Phytophthora boehmeriae]|uniref:Transmembrane protein n=1 Tax=Phytophthora boehmeriae TaxID=109152 RepID=A0A8T1X221_9STRA|nr:hypothetical protein PHYBOEH_007929 [Phytophthora boehmeriae]
MLRRRVLRLVRRGRRWGSSSSQNKAASAGPSPAKSIDASQTVVSASERRAAPGFVRIRKGFEAEKHEAEMDSTLARIIGSDWGDRSRQPVSMAMRVYWIVFGVVILNGVYTYLAGKDESFLVDKLRKKADEKLGVVEEENEFEEMADGNDAAIREQAAAGVLVPASEAVAEKNSATNTPASMLNTSAARSGMPFFSPAVTSASNARRVKTKPELERQLAELRLQQKRIKQDFRKSSNGTEREELEHQVRMIDIQKDQLKRMIKRL